jgi:hypothetical protein
MLKLVVDERAFNAVKYLCYKCGSGPVSSVRFGNQEDDSTAALLGWVCKQCREDMLNESADNVFFGDEGFLSLYDNVTVFDLNDLLRKLIKLNARLIAQGFHTRFRLVVDADRLEPPLIDVIIDDGGHPELNREVRDTERLVEEFCGHIESVRISHSKVNHFLKASDCVWHQFPTTDPLSRVPSRVNFLLNKPQKCKCGWILLDDPPSPHCLNPSCPSSRPLWVRCLDQNCGRICSTYDPAKRKCTYCEAEVKLIPEPDNVCKECLLGSCEFCEHPRSCACYAANPQDHIRARAALYGLEED